MNHTDNDYSIFEALFLDMYPDGIPANEIEDLYRRAYTIGDMIGDFSAIPLADTMYEISQEYDQWLNTPDTEESAQSDSSWFARNLVPVLAMLAGMIATLAPLAIVL